MAISLSLHTTHIARIFLTSALRAANRPILFAATSSPAANERHTDKMSNILSLGPIRVVAPYSSNTNRFESQTAIRTSGFPYLIRPGLLYFIDDAFKSELLSNLKLLFPDHWNKIPFAHYLSGNLEVATDHTKVDWQSTVWINGFHNSDALDDLIYPMLDLLEKNFYDNFKQQFRKTHIPTRDFRSFQARYFTTDATAPLKSKEYVMKVIDYDRYNAVVPAMFEVGSVPLAEIIPDIDHSHYDVAALSAFTNSRFNDIHAYLSNLNAHRIYHPKLQADDTFRSLERNLLAANDLKNVLFSVDLEAFEKNNDLITEIGITIYDPLKEAGSIVPHFTKIHIIIDEYKHLKNGTFVPDNQQYFIGGNSLVLSYSEAILFVQSLINHFFITRKNIGMNGLIVGHNVIGDMKWLRGMGVIFPSNVLVLDTQQLYSKIHGDKFSGLGAVLRRLNIPHSYLHNAGNDSYFTLLALLKLADVSFRNRFKLDDFNNDVKHLEDFQRFKDSRSQKVQNQINRSTNKNGRPTRIMKKKADNFEFAFDEQHQNHTDALESVFNK
jgi:hypothetical protein